MSAAPKFKIGDIVVVIPRLIVPSVWWGYEFTVTEVERMYYYENESSRWSEDVLELAPICKTPLWKALS